MVCLFKTELFIVVATAGLVKTIYYALLWIMQGSNQHNNCITFHGALFRLAKWMNGLQQWLMMKSF